MLLFLLGMGPGAQEAAAQQETPQAALEGERAQGETSRRQGEIQPVPEAVPKPRFAPEEPLEGPLDPARYRVGRGDVLVARLWGAQNFDLELSVDPDGQLFVPRLGPVKAQGRTLMEVAAEVERRLRSHYPRLAVAVTLVTARTFLVRVTGMVGKPGSSLPVHAWTRASEVLALAGGVARGGSSRRIELHRADGRVEQVDLPLYLQGGDLSHNPLLLDGDWLHVPLAEREVTILGAVSRPGIYELLEGTMAELIHLAGGLLPEATDRFDLRIVSATSGVGSLHHITFERESIATLPVELHHHDEVFVPSIHEGAKIVVKGALGASRSDRDKTDPRVAEPGAALRETTFSFPYVAGETIRSAILRAGGLASWADLSHAWIERIREDAAAGTQGVAAAPRDGAAGRTSPARGQGMRLRVDLTALFVDNDRSRDLVLQPGDTIYIPSARVDVVVSGHVMRPGIYGYSLKLGARDYLALAGGETREGDARRAYLVDIDGRTRKIDRDVRLLPGDSVVIPGKRLTAAEWAAIAISVTSTVLTTSVLVTTRLVR